MGGGQRDEEKKQEQCESMVGGGGGGGGKRGGELEEPGERRATGKEMGSRGAGTRRKGTGGGWGGGGGGGHVLCKWSASDATYVFITSVQHPGPVNWTAVHIAAITLSIHFTSNGYRPVETDRFLSAGHLFANTHHSHGKYCRSY